jgi:hypothetical protein
MFTLLFFFLLLNYILIQIFIKLFMSVIKYISLKNNITYIKKKNYIKYIFLCLFSQFKLFTKRAEYFKLIDKWCILKIKSIPSLNQILSFLYIYYSFRMTST